MPDNEKTRPFAALALDLTNVPMLRVDTQGVVTDIHRAAVRYSGIPSARWCGEPP